jgi:protein-tyrosine phosphatase
MAFATVLGARLLGDDPRVAFEGVKNFRIVDDRVWAGAQPQPRGYRQLGEDGVTLVVDLRTGADDDPRLGDPEQLAAQGIDHLALPIPDGHVPSSRQVERLVAAVDAAEGVVFVHCGGGVGRSTALTSAYARAEGGDHSVPDHLAIGPHTFEQAWFVATGDSNVVVRRVSELLDAPRRAWSRLRAAL